MVNERLENGIKMIRLNMWAVETNMHIESIKLENAELTYIWRNFNCGCQENWVKAMKENKNFKSENHLGRFSSRKKETF